MINARKLIGNVDLLFITLDSLRYDAACLALSQGLTPNLAKFLPDGVWQKRQSPGNFTYAAHQAFFAGFLPTPDYPGRHARLFAAAFIGSETTTEETFVFNAPNIVQGLSNFGYHTICIGGVGFFNKLTALGEVFPAMFAESHWSKEMGVTSNRSTELQVDLAIELIKKRPSTERKFLFINISAIHQPNCIFLEDAQIDSVASQIAALAYVDQHLGRLFNYLSSHRYLTIICSDHGTAYGEDGYWGNRVSHPVIWTVPYAEFMLE